MAQQFCVDGCKKRFRFHQVSFQNVGVLMHLKPSWFISIIAIIVLLYIFV